MFTPESPGTCFIWLRLVYTWCLSLRTRPTAWSGTIALYWRVSTRTFKTDIETSSPCLRLPRRANLAGDPDERPSPLAVSRRAGAGSCRTGFCLAHHRCIKIRAAAVFVSYDMISSDSHPPCFATRFLSKKTYKGAGAGVLTAYEVMRYSLRRCRTRDL